jgi:hypothetical protein
MAQNQVWVSVGIAAVGIMGTLLGTAAQHFYSIDRERRQALQKRQSDAYVDFLNVLDKPRVAAQLRADGKIMEAEKLEIAFEVEGGAAFRRIAIYGDKQVVEAMAEWSRQSTTLDPCPPHWKADLGVWQRMRETSLGGGQIVNARDLGELALFCRPPAE